MYPRSYLQPIPFFGQNVFYTHQGWAAWWGRSSAPIYGEILYAGPQPAGGGVHQVLMMMVMMMVMMVMKMMPVMMVMIITSYQLSVVHMNQNDSPSLTWISCENIFE